MSSGLTVPSDRLQWSTCTSRSEGDLSVCATWGVPSRQRERSSSSRRGSHPVLTGGAAPDSSGFPSDLLWTHERSRHDLRPTG